jgi:NAD(P)-dependent dehydrogenase (short-subunit alcohol dehydrogenase family)
MTKSNGKTAMITGSTDGVGRVVAKRLADDGWRVLVQGRDRGRGEALVADIKAAGGTAEFLQADLSSTAEVRRLAEAVQKTTRRLDLLINNCVLEVSSRFRSLPLMSERSKKSLSHIGFSLPLASPRFRAHSS